LPALNSVLSKHIDTKTKDQDKSENKFFYHAYLT
jgi:hypothetical protein